MLPRHLHQILEVPWVFLRCNQGWESLTELEGAHDNIKCCLNLNEAFNYKFQGRKEVLSHIYRYQKTSVAIGQEVEKGQQGDKGSLALVMQFIRKCYWTHLQNRILPVDRFEEKKKWRILPHHTATMSKWDIGTEALWQVWEAESKASMTHPWG